ncbi:AAA family ATPase [Candidatus Woesearchaeota archaeon]|nr:AAA family ATPase [Candidatus Woesearchaeota archaeon]
MNKIETGIKGFDKLVEGGFPKGKTILLSGTPGTGKTIFALQYLYNGATKFNEKGLYITFEEKIEDLKKQANQFGWDFDELEKKRKVKIISISSTELSNNTVNDIIRIAQNSNVNRLVVDSLSTLSINTPIVSTNVTDLGEFTIKRFIYSFIDNLKILKNITTLLISQNVSEGFLSSDKVSEFLCDGVIHLVYESMGGEFSRSLTIRKMREVKNDEDIHPLEIGKKGLVVHSIK